MAEPDIRAERGGSHVLAELTSSGVLFRPPLPLDALCGFGVLGGFLFVCFGGFFK